MVRVRVRIFLMCCPCAHSAQCDALFSAIYKYSYLLTYLLTHHIYIHATCKRNVEKGSTVNNW